MGRFRFFTLLIALSVLSAGALLALNKSSVSALSGSQFHADRIIDDSLFYRSGDMSVSQIQRFLDSKVTCDTNGTQSITYYYKSSTGEVHSYSFSGSKLTTSSRAIYGSRFATWYNAHPPKGYYVNNESLAPYICLQSFTDDILAESAQAGICNALSAQADQSAATIIYKVSQACGISAKVLIVTLQKEQALVTDSWPWKNQYNQAMGYGCFDTTGCKSTYADFFKQVYDAAWQFKTYRANPGSYDYRAGFTSHIKWNPNSSCGTSSLVINNNATAGLYIYTPYRPNQAALDNLYGTGNSCSSYGNRNFWRYYNDWFGNSLYNGPIIPLAGDWDGDGNVTVGLKVGNFYMLDNDNDGIADTTFTYGTPGAVAIVGDFNGDGIDTISLKIGNKYYINNHEQAGGTERTFNYGTPGAVPVAGNWDGTGGDTISVKIGNKYYINNSWAPHTDYAFAYGTNGSLPLSGDWDNDGTDTISVKIGNKYYINNELAPGTDSVFQYGRSGDMPISGDFDNDGTDTISLRIGDSFYINNGLTPGSDYKFEFVN